MIHEVVDHAVGRLARHYAQENPDEGLAAVDGIVARTSQHRAGRERGTPDTSVHAAGATSQAGSVSVRAR